MAEDGGADRRGAAAVTAARHVKESGGDWRPGCTETANAYRMAKNFGSELRYCPAWGSWLCWDGRRWRRDATKRVWRLARATVRRIYVEASRLEDLAERKRLTKWAIQSESRAALANMIDLASSEPGIAITPGELDSDPWLFNLMNGTLDLRTGALEPHDRGALITKLAPVVYDGAAAAPLFTLFLDRIFARNAELIAYVQRLLGSALVGEVQDHVLPVAYGTGANGKTTLFEVMQYVLGEYAMAGAPDLLLESRHDRHPTEVADLFGVRLVVCREPNRGVRLDEARVKELTGGDTIKARFMRMDFFSFKPSHTAILIVNHKPVVRGADNAIWRRLKLVPFGVTIPEAEWDVELAAKLRREASGIAAWLVRGCLGWQREGLSQPKVVTEATAGYRSEMDAFGAFLAECCRVDKAAEVAFGELYGAYVDWCQREREKPMSKTSMGIALAERGFVRRQSGGRLWAGLERLERSSGSPHEETPAHDQPDNRSNGSRSSSNGAVVDDLDAEQLDVLYPDADVVEGVT